MQWELFYPFISREFEYVLKQMEYSVPLGHFLTSAGILFYLLWLPSTTIPEAWVTAIKHHLTQHLMLLSWIRMTLILNKNSNILISVTLKKPPTLIMLLKAGQVEVYYFRIKQNRSELVASTKTSDTHFWLA